MTLYCPNCHYEFAPDDLFCGKCGWARPAPIQKSPTMVLSQNPPPNSANSGDDEPSPVSQALATVPPLPEADPHAITAEIEVPTYLTEEAPPIGALDGDITDPSLPSFWQCTQCNTLNPTAAEYCENCGAASPNTNPVKLGQAEDLVAFADTSTVKVPTDLIAALAAEHAETRRGWRFRSSSATDEGLARKSGTNEDSQFTLELSRAFESRREEFGFYLVCDGMGGQAAGEVASRIAVETVAGIILQELARPWMSGATLRHPDVEKVMQTAVLEAHKELREYNQREFRDAGTTLTACCLLEDWAVFANVGDSRTYLFRLPEPPSDDRDKSTDKLTEKLGEEVNPSGVTITVRLPHREGTTNPLKLSETPAEEPAELSPPKLKIERVTRDQSLVQNLVDQGEISIDEVYSDPRRNVILYALGAPDENLPVDIYYRELELGDTVLLCSDGLWEMVRDNQIAETIETAPNLQACSQKLIELANLNGGADNISAVVVHIEKD